jgi:type IV secretory pathway TraG/TraD family ATPase VirD4
MELPHTYIIGQSGSGKSSLMRHMMLDHIHDGHGIFFLDPHGYDTDTLLDYIPKKRRKDVIVFDPSGEYPIPWNPIADIPETEQPFVASTFVDAIKTAWGYDSTSTPVMDMYLYFSIASLMSTGGSLKDIPYLLSDKEFRQTIKDKLTDTVLNDFWQQFDDRSGKEQRAEVSSTINKFWTLIGDPRIRHVIGQKRVSFRMPDVLEGQIFLARLPQGKLGIGKTALLGSLLLSQAHVASLSRNPATPFHFFIDEAHTWSSSTLCEMLTGIRKYGGRMVLAHQYVDQLDRKLFTALMGNCPIRQVFRVSPEDAKTFHAELSPQSMHPNLDTLDPLWYRTFPFDERKGDNYLPVLPYEPYPASRKVIEANMRRNYARK